ncbi:MAG: hypothetical protein ABIG44_10090 [Planctomycetota bacterium]
MPDGNDMMALIGNRLLTLSVLIAGRSLTLAVLIGRARAQSQIHQSSAMINNSTTTTVINRRLGLGGVMGVIQSPRQLILKTFHGLTFHGLTSRAHKGHP